MALKIRGIEAAGPSALTTPETTKAFYDKLCSKWEIPKEVGTYLEVELEIKDEEDFLACFRSDKDWDAFNDADIKIGQAQVKRGPRGRVYRAYKALKEAETKAVKQASIGEDTSDLDVLLDSADIKEFPTRGCWHRPRSR